MRSLHTVVRIFSVLLMRRIVFKKTQGILYLIICFNFMSFEFQFHLIKHTRGKEKYDV